MIEARSIPRGLVLGALVLAGLAGFGSLVQAGECPADQVVADGRGQAPGSSLAKGVTDTVLGSIQLANEVPGLEGRDLRLRRLVVEPGGVVPWHNHDDRPAIIHIQGGRITEYRNTCAVPIVHKAGDVVVETRGTAHWWKNEGRKVATLTASDVFHAMPEADDRVM